MELKHFSNELKGWEEKNETIAFPLVKITSNAVYFDGMTFVKISDDEMHVYVEIKADNKTSEFLFTYNRVKN